jgi:hypothetical protein
MRCPFLARGATKVAETVDLLTGRDGDRMSIGSAKRPGRRTHRESPENASEECFYRHVLDSHLRRLLVQRSSAKVCVMCDMNYEEES